MDNSHTDCAAITYITLDDALADAPEGATESPLEAEWLTMLNSLPVFPESLESAMTVFADHIAALYPDVGGLSILLGTQPVGNGEPPVSDDRPNARPQRSRGRDRRHQYPHRASTVADIVSENWDAAVISIPVVDERDLHIATVEWHVAEGSAFSESTLQSLPAVMVFIKFVVTDLLARCAMLSNRRLPSLDDLTAQIARDAGLTKRDHSILRMIMGGASYIETAQQLSLSVETVKKHMKKVYDRTQADGIAGLFATYASLCVRC